jgi:hypothetical protein
MDGDRPVTRRDDDRLGFSHVVERLAESIMGLPAAAGFVFGIEGRWGSGKSTLIALTTQALKSYGPTAPEIINFCPWLVGERDVLLRSIFTELASAAAKIDPVDAEPANASTASWWPLNHLARSPHSRLKQRERFKRNIGAQLERFGVVAGGLGKVAKVADAVGIPLAGRAAAVLEVSGGAAKEIISSTSISKEKAYLVDALAQLSRRIIVFIDDLDRLEPREAIEVLRLVRAVADFPNIIYVLSYDPVVMAQTLTKAVQIDDGAAYLEKIVQVSFRVPRPEAFDLRRWFETEVYKLFDQELSSGNESNQVTLARRLAQVIDVYGGRYLETGRDVVRVLNALRLQAIPVRSQIDVADMVWLQLTKIGNSDFYCWVEEYLVEAAAITGGATISHAHNKRFAQRLESFLQVDSQGLGYEVFELSEILPGIRAKNGKVVLFDDLRGNSREKMKASRRLGSPQHYRYYFAFSMPAGAVTDEQVQAFLMTAQHSPGDAVQMFLDFSRVARPQGGTLADMVIDRVCAWSKRISPSEVSGVLKALADTMDLPELSKAADFGRRPAWELATRAVRLLLGQVTGEVRANCLRVLFWEGAALGWLTEVLRGEIFSHGRYGDRPEPSERRLLNDGEFEAVLSTMLNRYRETDPDELMRVPDLMNVLFAWLQGGGTDEARKWVSDRIQTEEGLLAFLSLMRTWAARNETVYYPIRRANLEHFLDFDVAVRRLDRLVSGDATLSEAQRRLVLEVLDAIAQGEGSEPRTDSAA